MPQLKVREGGTWVSDFTVKNRDPSSWQVDVNMIKMYLGSGWVTFHPAESSSGSPIILVSMASVSNPLNIFSFTFNGSDANSEVIVTAAGDVQTRKNLAAAVDVGDWITDKTGLNGALYEIRATLNSGILSAGSDVTGTFLGLGTSRNWNVNQIGGGNGVEAANITLRIQKILDTGDFAEITVDLNATTEL